MKSARKIRKTNELFWFSPEKENIHPKNNQRSSEAISLQHVEKSSMSKVKDKKNGKKVKKQSTSTILNSPKIEKDDFDTNANISEVKKLELSVPEEPMMNESTSKRKIIKAKRLLQRSQINKIFEENAMVEGQSDSRQNVALMKKEVDSHDLNSSVENKPIVLDMEESVLTASEQNINTTYEKDFSIDEIEKTSDTIDVIIENLSVSPSLNSVVDNSTSPQFEHLQFFSSKEQLFPSTSGTVETSPRRRTFELEDSITDIELLKSVSVRDSFRINSNAADTDLKQCNTPTNDSYSKVTMRKRWDKLKIFSPYDTGFPSNNNRLSRTVGKKTSPKIKSQTFSEKKLSSNLKTSASGKKYTSKVKIPNFAAIHEKALSKIESITEYKQRKEDRAKMLLSGRKPGFSSTKKKEFVTPIPQEKVLIKKESRKHLRFAPNTTLQEKSPTFIPLPSTPLPKLVMQKNECLAVIQPFRFGSPKTANPLASDERKCRIPALKPEKLPEKRVLAPKNKEVPVTKESNHILQKNKQNVVLLNNAKSIITKSKPAGNALESRRCAIKGVRSNRRFELLMNMRKGK